MGQKPIKIGFDAKRLFSGRGGLQSYARILLLNLSTYYPENQYHLYTPEVKDRAVYEEFSSIQNVHIRQSASVVKAYWRSKSMVKDLMKDGIKVYHGLSGELPIGINKSGIKSIVTIHDLLWQEFPEDYSVVDRYVYDWKLKGAVKQADKIIAVSEQTKTKLLEAYPENNVAVINPIVAPEFFHQHDLKENQEVLKRYGIDKNYVLAIGNSKGRKNIKQFIDFIIAEIHDLSILLIGNRGDLPESVKVINQVAYQDMPALYQSAIACIYPSLGEGFGLPILEAITSGKAVVTHDASPMNTFDSPLRLTCDTRDKLSARKAMKKAIEISAIVAGESKPDAKVQRYYAETFMNIYQSP